MKPKFSAYIDKITNSIELIATGESLQTIVLPVTTNDIQSIHKKDGWKFNWKNEHKQKDERKIVKLVTVNEPNIIQGLISFIKSGGYYYLPLIELAPFNIGRHKKYAGVAANLVAYVCKLSFEDGFQGVVSFTPKTRLIDHYSKSIGAEMISRNDMAIFTASARKLVTSYFKYHEKEK
jgi:hypothetical protein